jgi:hypothetical protein
MKPEVKFCIKCRQFKPKLNFDKKVSSRHADARIYYTTKLHCQECNHREKEHLNPLGRHCNKCHTFKTWEHYAETTTVNLKGVKLKYRRATCKPCVNVKRKAQSKGYRLRDKMQAANKGFGLPVGLGNK